MGARLAFINLAPNSSSAGQAASQAGRRTTLTLIPFGWSDTNGPQLGSSFRLCNYIKLAAWLAG